MTRWKAFYLSDAILRFTRRAMLLGIFLDLMLVAISSLGINSPLKMQGGGAYVIKTVILLVLYGLVVVWASTKASISCQTALRLGASAGVFGGLLQMLHMTLENFGHRVGENSIVTLAFMAGGFLIWGGAGYCVTRSTGEIKDGLVASCWSAMVSVVIAATFGLVLMSANIPPPEYVATWGEFKQSGWADARAFAIANSLDAAFSHLVIGPIVGTIVGLLGVSIAWVWPRRAAAKSEGGR